MDSLANTYLKRINKTRPRYPERIIQFGTGNFLRGFVDAFVHHANEQGVFNGSIVVVQSTPSGNVPTLNEQDGLYTLALRGRSSGSNIEQHTIITSVSRGLISSEQWEDILTCAENPAIDVLISNTTEAGLTYNEKDQLDDRPPSSFPGKVCAYLYRRYQKFAGAPDAGMLLIPCELVHRNGDVLRDIVVRLAQSWQLEAGFINWITAANTFASTLVDRIVTGYPEEKDAQKLFTQFGYNDQLLVVGEPFHLWVIEAPHSTSERFPLQQANSNILWVDDLAPYETRKIRILNGAHTATCAIALLADVTTVKSAMDHHLLNQYIKKVIFNEIIPTLTMQKEELVAYANDVLERFSNPFIEHHWRAIALHSVPKFRNRVLPSLRYHLEQGNMPPLLSIAFAALIYHAMPKELASATEDEISQILTQEELWGEDLTSYPALVNQVKVHIDTIKTTGILGTIAPLLEKENADWKE